MEVGLSLAPQGFFFMAFYSIFLVSDVFCIMIHDILVTKATIDRANRTPSVTGKV